MSALVNVIATYHQQLGLYNGWRVASEHFYNMTNIGLNIHSDLLCDINRKKK